MGDPKECFKTHSILHSISGLGVGLILVAFVPALVENALLLGIVVLGGAIVAEFVLKGKK